MADKKISQLPSVTTPLGGTEQFAVVQSGDTKKVTVDSLTQGRTVKASGLQVPSNTGIFLFTDDGGTGYSLNGGTATPSNQLNEYVGGLNVGNYDSAGNYTVKLGNLVIGTSGKGIDFSADGSAAGMTSELLDDYEEGTWTPALKFGSGTTGITYGSQTGSYVKIGNLVTVTARIELTSKGSDSGVAYITGLPFAVENTLIAFNTGAAFNSFFNMANISGWVASRANPNDTVLQLNTGSGSTGVTDVSQGNFTDTTSLGITVTYKSA